MKRRLLKKETSIKGYERKIDCNTIGTSTMFSELKFIYNNRHLMLI